MFSKFWFIFSVGFSFMLCSGIKNKRIVIIRINKKKQIVNILLFFQNSLISSSILKLYPTKISARPYAKKNMVLIPKECQVGSLAKFDKIEYIAYSPDNITPKAKTNVKFASLSLFFCCSWISLVCTSKYSCCFFK